ncbi:MAG: DUF1549 domain-containing protein, partial [Planctomycetaceae bacterium]|nr:DUF1549 domain-containing protein [Planctomycetaceae bacterium]
MSRLPYFILMTLLFLVTQRFSSTLRAEDSAAEKLFALQVLPLLQEKCFSCHGADADNIEGGLDLTSRAAVLRGGESFAGEVLIPGKAERSQLYLVVRREDPDFAMPPKEAEKLTEEQTLQIRDWINAGAVWPAAERIQQIVDQHAPGVKWATSGGLSADWTSRRYREEDLWGWQPLRRDFEGRLSGLSAPAVIDSLIDDRLQQRELVPAPPADRRTFIRRATFDLLGLPPTPDEV